VRIEHVGGDHAADSTVVYVEQDRLLFLGDSLYESTSGPKRTLTTTRAFPLVEAVLGFDADLFVEGHTETVMSRAEMAELITDIRLAGTLVDGEVSKAGFADEAAVLVAAQQRAGEPASDQLRDLIRAFVAGRS
jgi:glyoxylase-like metal-dependent hydrolase (beta-lactamase superfamily II)